MLATTDKLLKSGKRVILVEDIPEMNVPVADCAERPFRFVPPRQDCSMALDAHHEQTQAASRVFAAARQALPQATIVDPQSLLCDSRRCYARTSGTLLYMSDGNHLTYEGARLLGKWLIDSHSFSVRLAKGP